MINLIPLSFFDDHILEISFHPDIPDELRQIYFKRFFENEPKKIILGFVKVMDDEQFNIAFRGNRYLPIVMTDDISALTSGRTIRMISLYSDIHLTFKELAVVLETGVYEKT